MKSGYVSLSDLDCFIRAGRCFAVLTAYFDESYNNRTLCIGGWLCGKDGWKSIESKWAARIEHENRISIKKNLKAISRYHASDCASLRGDFEGWTVTRQIALTKKLLIILDRSKQQDLGAVAIGLKLDDMAKAWPTLKKKDLRWEAYKLCMSECLVHVGELMRDYFPHERVTVIHDRGDYDSAAKSAFDIIYNAKDYPLNKYFISIAPGAWHDFIALQPADLIAFEGFKLTDRHKHGNMDIRKSLQAIVGKGIAVRAAYFSPDAMRDLASKGMYMTTLNRNKEARQ